MRMLIIALMMVFISSCASEYYTRKAIVCPKHKIRTFGEKTPFNPKVGDTITVLIRKN